MSNLTSTALTRIHAAYDDAPVGDVYEMYQAIAALSLIVERLPVLADHIARRVDQLGGIDGLGTDDTTTEDPAVIVAAISTAIRTSLVEPTGAVQAISDAHSRLSALKISQPDNA